MRPANYKELGVSRTSQLKMYPKGYDYFDEILLCALILSRHYPEKYTIQPSSCFEQFLTESCQEPNGYLPAGDVTKGQSQRAGALRYREERGIEGGGT